MSRTPSKMPRRQLRERRGRSHQVEQLVDRPVVHRRPSRRSAGRARRAGCADSASLRHGLRAWRASRPRTRARSPRYFGKMMPRLTPPTWWLGTSDSLEPARHRGRRFDLHHQVDRAHVDAELERRRGDEAAQRAGLERAPRSRRAAHARAIRGARARAARRRDRSTRRASRSASAPAVDEDERRAVRRISSSSRG